MKVTFVLILLALITGAKCPAATITYTYDAQHRLVQASYSASEKVFHNHDAAGNVDQHVVITDAKYLESWLLYFSLLDSACPSLSSWETTLRSLLFVQS